MLHLLVMDNVTDDSYACVFEKNGVQYYANVVKEENGKIVCEIHRIQAVPHIMTRFSIEELKYRDDSDGNFLSPTTLARHVERFVKEEVDWVYYDRNAKEE